MLNQANSLVLKQSFDRAKAEEIIDLLDVATVTRKDYKYRIPRFLSFLEQNPISYNSFLEYKRLLEKMNISVASKNKYLVVARIFIKELARQGILPVDITLNIKSFPQNKKHKKEGISEAEVLQLVSYIRTFDSSQRNIRKKALFCLLALQGLRQIEIIRLNTNDIDVVNKIAYVQGKGKSDKEIVHLHPETVKTLQEYIRICKIRDGALFKSLGNRKSDRITTMTIKREVKDMLSPLGIAKSPHAFRHYYITRLLQKFPVRDVRKFSRHSNLEMLVVYDDEIDMKKKSTEVFQVFNNLSVMV